jgi:high affinity Mn2+ porin
MTLYAGMRLWQGAEFWIDPEIDQGFGLADTHGAAGFPSAAAFKIGASFPYARVQRYFVRQTIDLGGESEKADADLNKFAGTQTANRLVLTVGKFRYHRHIRRQQLREQPQRRFPKLVGHQCRHVRLC